MDRQKFLTLIDKYLEGNASLEEEQQLLNFYGSFQEDGTWNEKAMGAKQEIENQMLLRLQERVKQGSNKQGQIRLWPRIIAAASVLLVLAAGLWLFDQQIFIRDSHDITLNSRPGNDINPGKNTATLTLGNGKTIQLSEVKSGVNIGAAELTYNDGSKVRASIGDPSLYSKEMTATTPRGGQYTITLPDGTKVWLNAASSLKFPASFAQAKQRRVELNGEAYFEVAKDKAHPFIVTSNQQAVEVLGTHFNISGYADETNTKTTLLEGRVRITSGGTSSAKNEVILSPGQQASLVRNSGNIKVAQADPEEVMAWKNGLFMFSGQDLESIMKQVSRWYDVDVEYKDAGIRKQIFDGTVSRFKNISQLLQVLESTGSVHFKVEGRRVIVTK